MLVSRREYQRKGMLGQGPNGHGNGLRAGERASIICPEIILLDFMLSHDASKLPNAGGARHLPRTRSHNQISICL